MNNKLKRIDSLQTNPKHARSYSGPATAGMEYDDRQGFVVADKHDLFRTVGPDRTKYVLEFDDFLGDAVDARWNTQEGTDPETTFGIFVDLGGVLRLTTGNAGTGYAADGVQFEGRLNWQANKGNLTFETRVRVDAITNVAAFIGFTDQTAALEEPASLSGTTFTRNATDLAGFLFDTAATTDTWRVVGKGVGNDFDSGFAPVATAYEVFRVDVDVAGFATFYRNNVLVRRLTAAAVSPTVPLVPVLAVTARSTTSRLWDFDFLQVGQSRG